MKKIVRNIYSFVKENPFSFSIFVLSTIFFLFQHYSLLGWDFSAYVLNAKYLFGLGDYFEVYRAPMISFIIGVFLFLGKFSEYIYIFLISLLFLYSNFKLSTSLFEKYFYKYNIKKNLFCFLFYLFSLSPFVLSFGLIEGTELLALSFFELFLANLLLNKLSGHLLGLAVLSRYNFLLYSVLMLFNKDYKKILKNFGLMFLVFLPWMIFNKIRFGSWFSSFVDSYFLNVASRAHLFQPFDFSALLAVIGFSLPLLLIGIIVLFFKIINWKKERNLVFILFLAISVLMFYEVYSVPFKILRYLFILSLPAAFFSVLGFSIINKFRKISKIVILFFVLYFLFSVSFSSYAFYKERSNGKMFYDAAIEIKNLGIENCRILSNYWVPVNYYSNNIFFMSSNISAAIDNKEIVLIFYNLTTMDDKFNMNEVDNFPYLSKKDKFVFIASDNITGSTCLKKEREDIPLVDNPCEIISNKFSKLGAKKAIYVFCSFIDGK